MRTFAAVAVQDNVEVRRGGSAATGAGPQVFGDAQAHRRGPGHEDGVSTPRQSSLPPPLVLSCC